MKAVKLLAPFIVSTLSIPTIYLAGCNQTPTTNVPVQDIKMVKENVGCSIHDKLTLEYKIEPSDATDKSVTWDSSDKTVATIDDNGVITSYKEGTTTITVKTNDGGFEDSCELNVYAPLCFEKAGSTGDDDPSISYKIQGGGDLGANIETSEDGENWSRWSAETNIEIDDGKKLYVRNTKDTLSLNAIHYFKFLIAENNEIKASGNVNSMINYSDLTNHCYHSMFYECQGLISAPKLPSTKLADYCYNNMFANCGALNTAPELPATNLTEGCYRTMFARCVSLFSAPLLRINYLARFCCHSMFMNCSDLYIKENNETAVDPLVLDLTNITVPEYSTEDMFSGTSGSFSGTPQHGNKYFWY